MIYVYTIGPIDWYHGAVTVEEISRKLAVPDTPEERCGPERSTTRTLFQALRIEVERYCYELNVSEPESHWVTPIFAACLPRPDCCDTFWTFWRKEWNNGTVYFFSEEPLPYLGEPWEVFENERPEIPTSF